MITGLHMPDFSQARVLVIGDVMLDRYWYGSTARISPEAPVPVVQIKKTEDRLGGAANVACNIRSLGAASYLLGISGEDAEANHLEQQLQALGINYFLHREISFPTITKLRIISRNQQLIRLDFEESHRISPVTQVESEYQQQLSAVDLVVISDYGKGTVKDPKPYIQMAHDAKIPVLVDPKGTDFSRYYGATLLTPNRQEFEAVFGVCRNDEDLIAKGQQAIMDLGLQALLITRSEQGMTLLQRDKPAQHFFAQAKQVYDVTGAGDTSIAVLAASMAAGSDIAQATQLANVAAGIVVSRMGAVSVTVPELRRALHETLGKPSGIVNLNQLLQLVADAKAHQETIVMTNGCFDLLHAGHVHYLQQAKDLGDRLIVAVNDDASVRRLKSNSRPINSLDRRMEVLAALGSVDWVVPFSEDTPFNLIQKIVPTILVKGGDYHEKNIVGADLVIANGGQVKVIPFVDGCSTTNLIEKILHSYEGEKI